MSNLTMNQGMGWVVIQIPMLLLAFVLPSVLSEAICPWSASSYLWRDIVGTLCLLLGGALLALGTLRLGTNLTALPRPKAQGQLVTSGIYRLVRHPMYGGIVLLAFGRACHAATWLLIPMDVLLLCFFSLKANREEQWLMEKFKDYAQYRRHTAKLIPWIY